MKQELKMAILKWLYDNENVFNRVNACVEYFKEYIYDSTGNFLKYGIGRETYDFIVRADKLLFGKEV